MPGHCPLSLCCQSFPRRLAYEEISNIKSYADTLRTVKYLSYSCAFSEDIDERDMYIKFGHLNQQGKVFLVRFAFGFSRLNWLTD